MSNRVVIPNEEGFEFVPIDDIVYCKASGSYTEVVLPGRRILVTRSLKEMEHLCAGFPFVRIHHSFLIHLNHLVRYYRRDGGEVEMSTGDRLPVSRAKRQAFLDSVNGGKE